MVVIGPFEHGSLLINGREIYFQNGRASVSDEIGNELIKRPGYRKVENKLQIKQEQKPIRIERTGVENRVIKPSDIKPVTLMRYRDDIDVSIIIPTYNRLEDIKNCVASIYDNTKAITYEIIIVDGTGVAAEYFSDHTPIVYLKDTENLGATHAFNFGFMNAMGKWTVWLNDDTIVTKDWLKIALEFMDKNPGVGLGAFFFREQDENGKYVVFPENVIYDGEYCVRTFASWTIHSTRVYANFGILKTSLMKKLNYFNERAFKCYASDTDFSHRVIKNGLDIKPIFGAKVIHLNRQDENRKKNVFADFQKDTINTWHKYHSMWGVKGI